MKKSPTAWESRNLASHFREKESASAPSPPAAQEEERKRTAKPAFTSPDEDKDDIFEFTSATEGEVESLSAWELVPEKKVARKVGVKSDAELDQLVKKVIAEAKTTQITSAPPASTCSSSKDVTSAANEEDVAATNEEEAAAYKEEAAAAAAKKITPATKGDSAMDASAPEEETKDVSTSRLRLRRCTTSPFQRISHPCAGKGQLDGCHPR